MAGPAMKIEFDAKRLRPLFVPGGLMAGAVLLWLLAIPLVEARHAETAGVVNRLRGDLLTLRGETSRMLGEAQQLRQIMAEYQRLQAEGLMLPQDRLAAIRLAERQAQMHQLSRMQVTLGPESVMEGPAFTQGDVTVATSNVTVDMGGLLDRNLVEYVRGVQQQLGGRTQIGSLAMEKERSIPENADLDPRSISDINVRGTVVLNWRTIKAPPPAKQAEAK
jgi:hypothetical protein